MAASSATLRHGGVEDLEVLYALIHEAARAESSEHLLKATLGSTREDYLKGAFSFLLAIVEDEVAGMAMYYPLWDDCRCGGYLYLDDVSVKAEFRGRGIGTQLLRALQGYANAAAASSHADGTEGTTALADRATPRLGVRFQVLRDNEAALRLYRRLGASLSGGLLNVSLSGPALRRVLETTWPNPPGVKVRPARRADASQVAELIKELAVYERQAENYVDWRLPIEDTTGEFPEEATSFWRAPRIHFLVAERSLPEKGSDHEAAGANEANGGEAAVLADATTSTPDSRLLGLAVFVPCYASWTGRRAYMQCLVVAEGARRQGVGCQLVQAVVRCMTEELGIAMLQWRVYDWNESAKTFYEKHLGAKVNATGDWLNASLPPA